MQEQSQDFEICASHWYLSFNKYRTRLCKFMLNAVKSSYPVLVLFMDRKGYDPLWKHRQFMSLKQAGCARSTFAETPHNQQSFLLSFFLSHIPAPARNMRQLWNNINNQHGRRWFSNLCLWNANTFIMYSRLFTVRAQWRTEESEGTEGGEALKQEKWSTLLFTLGEYLLIYEKKKKSPFTITEEPEFGCILRSTALTGDEA